MEETSSNFQGFFIQFLFSTTLTTPLLSYLVSMFGCELVLNYITSIYSAPKIIGCVINYYVVYIKNRFRDLIIFLWNRNIFLCHYNMNEFLYISYDVIDTYIYCCS
jgi:hypothetical protein